MLTISRNPELLAAAAARDLALAKAEASAAVVRDIEAILDQFTRDYPKQEQLAWGSKYDAAQRVLEGGSEPIITREANKRGVAPSVTAAKIVAKGTFFNALVGIASAVRGEAQDAIAAATTQAELQTALELVAGKIALMIPEATAAVTPT